MSELIMSISGIRGVVGASLTPEIVHQLVRTWGETFGGPVVVGRDSRPSGSALQEVAIDELLRQGHAVYRVDLVPTPTIGRAVRHWKAAAGLQITASHNPPQWNGLKFFTAQGRALPPELATPLLQRLRISVASSEVPNSKHPTASDQRRAASGAVPVKLPETEDSHSCLECGEEALQDHLAAVLACVEVDVIRRRAFRVLVDGNGGAGGPLAVRLLEALGCQVFPLHCVPDGIFRHAPEPTPQSLHQVAPEVVRCGCDLGVALDTDADRLVLLDEQGRCLSEEFSLALAVEARLRQQPGPVVTNLSTSRLVELVCQWHGCPCYHTPVGEAHVVDGMLAHVAVLGGEGNGGIIDPRIGWIRDPFIGMALVLQLLSELKRPLSVVVARWPTLVMRKEKFPLGQLDWPTVRDRLLARVGNHRPHNESAPVQHSQLLPAEPGKAQGPSSGTSPPVTVDTRDGVYLGWSDRFLHVRPSNTEPVVRVVAEATSEADTNLLVRLAHEAILGSPG